MFSLWRTLLLMWLMAFLFLVQACGKEDTNSEQSSEGPASAPEGVEAQKGKGSVLRLPEERLKGLGIQVEAVRMGVIPETITATASIEPNQNRIVHVTPRIPGRALQVLVDLGATVQEGKRLAILDSVELGEAKAEYRKAKVRMEADRVEYERQQKLYDKGITAQKSLLDAKRGYLVAKAEFEGARERLHLYGLSSQEIEAITQGHSETISWFPVVAPLTGTVIEKHLVPGEFVTPETTLFTIADLSTVWVILDIYEKDLAKIEVGHPVTISVASYPDQSFTGRMTYISDLVDEKTRTAKVRVEIHNLGRKLKPGMFAEARIATHGKKTLLLVPKSAVVHIDDKPVVFVEISDTEFQKRDVQLGAESDGWLEITNGVKEGEVVVTHGSFYLKAELLREQIGGEE